jgi:malonyl CoA-acyl carrier protein transacylase
MVEQGGVEAFVEIGPGTVLKGLIRRIVRGVPVINIAEPGDLSQLAELGG